MAEKIAVRNLYGIFGTRPELGMELLRQGRGKDLLASIQRLDIGLGAGKSQ